LKFVKYLPEFGYEPTVVTVENGSYPATDESLLEDIPNGTRVIHTKTREPFEIYNLLRGKKGKSVEVGMGNLKGKRSLLKSIAAYIRANYFIPDARKGWNPYAIKAVKAQLSTDDYHAILTTGPPHSTHLVGQKIKNATGIKWVADFRDPWTSMYYNKFLPKTGRTKRKDAILESGVLKTADLTVVLSKGMAKEFEDRARQLHIIYNGYDPDDFNIDKEKLSGDPTKFTLSYIGNFKVNQNIQSLWLALKRAIREIPEFADTFALRTVGNVNTEIASSIVKHGLERYWERLPFVPHHDAIQYMKSASLLLQPIPMAENNAYILTGKMFEYLASRTPILAIGPMGGEADRLHV
jgi:glycosyltransferase involved in cell wall biosynthesis